MWEERDLGGDARRILRAADIAAERVAALVRMAAAILLVLVLELATSDVTIEDAAILTQIAAARITLSLLFVSGALAWGAIRFGRWSPALGYLTSTADIALILGNIWSIILHTGYPGDVVFALPSVWVFAIIFAASALRFRPGLQTYVSLIGLGGLLGLTLAAGHFLIPERRAITGGLTLLFGPPPNIVRFGMLTVAAGVLILATVRARLLLVRAVAETSQRRALTRFLPSEIADILSDDAPLRRGSRQPASVLFIDMRDSTALAEAMAPEELSAFMTEFRSRISRTVRTHGGVIDKFIGDGALVLFGVPEPRPDDAARALACARALAADLEDWNRTRAVPVGFGIGLHHGPVFFGVVGDPSRLEATVLGDTVNVAARLEKATRDHDVSIIVSGETLDAAGLARSDGRLRPLGTARLRGRSAEVDLYALGSGEARPASPEALHAT